MNELIFSKYEIWHDESKKGGFHHGVLFVPVDMREVIIAHIKKIRQEFGYGLGEDAKYAGSLQGGKHGAYIRNILALFAHVIQKRFIKSTQMFNRTERDKYEGKCIPFLTVSGLFNCKFGLLKSVDNFSSLTCSIYKNKVELTCGFITKCCAHGMFGNNDPIEIVKVYLDGDEHHGGGVNPKKLFKGDFRNYCKISEDIEIDSRHLKERTDETRIMINFIDNIVGAWRSKLNKESDVSKVLLPLDEIYQRLNDGKICSNINSRWYKSICCSELIVEKGNIEFIDIFRDKEQMELW